MNKIKRAKQLIKQNKLSHRQIQAETGLALATISKCRGEMGLGYRSLSKNGHRVLCIGDVHEPCSRKGYLQFCRDIYKKYRCDTVVFLGDIVDWHAVSFHDKHPQAPGSGEEYRQTKEKIKDWYKAFPKASVCIGNHDERPERIVSKQNVPADLIKEYSDVWGTPGWQWGYEFKIDGVLYFHGVGCTGEHPAFNAAKKKAESVVLGHTHSASGVKWMANSSKRWFGMDVGCGIDDDAVAFVYARHQIKRSIISCGVVLNGKPYHEIMPLEEYK